MNSTMSFTERHRLAVREATRDLLILFLLVLLPRIVVVTQTVAPARDAFKYFHAAERFEQLPPSAAIRSLDVHPLYPVSLHVLRGATLSFFRLDDPYLFWHIAQIWSILCYGAFIAFAYGFGRIVWGRKIAFAGALISSLLPRQLEYSTDVLCDNLLAALVMAAFWLGALGLHSPRLWKWSGAGLLCGLAYCTHLGGIIAPVVLLSSGMVALFYHGWLIRRRGLVSGMVALTLTTAGVLGGYLSINGGLSPRLAALDILGKQWFHAPEVPTAMEEPSAPATRDIAASESIPTASPMPSPMLSVPVPSGPLETPLATPELAKPDLLPRPFEGMEGYERLPVVPALQRVLREFGEELRVLFLILALYAVVDRKRLQSHKPAGLIVFFATLFYVAMLAKLQLTGGYVAGRYALPLIPLLVMYGLTGAEAFWNRLMAIARRLSNSKAESEEAAERSQRRLRLVGVGILSVVTLILSSKGILDPIHASHYGHMQAARWLRQHSGANERVFDYDGHASYFAQRRRWLPPEQNEVETPARFAVVDQRDVYRCQDHVHATIVHFHQEGRLVAAFPRKEGSTKATVFIYELNEAPPEAVSEQDRSQQPEQVGLRAD